uniref:CUB domain-containing protein n=1 Tax=Trichuris muris TaxID=70415 RepID=A0A5S6R1I8_TRIMR
MKAAVLLQLFVLNDLSFVVLEVAFSKQHGELCLPNIGVTKATNYTCPESHLRISADRVCDGHPDCRTSLADELHCVLWQNYSTLREPAAVRIYLPHFKCHSFICAPTSHFVSYLLCRQMGAAMFDNISSVVNVGGVVALTEKALSCEGAEFTIQECLNRLRASLLARCARLLAISCLRECVFTVRQENGTIHSVGFPHFQLPNTDCTWRLEVPPNKVIELKFLEINLHNSMEESEYPCTTNYVELMMHNSYATTKDEPLFLRQRICNSSSAGRLFMSNSSRIWIRHVTGLQRKSADSVKGFSLHFRSIQDQRQPKKCEKLADGVSVAAIVLSTIAGLLGAFGLAILSLCAARMIYRRRQRRKYASDWAGSEEITSTGNVLTLDIDETGNFVQPLLCKTCNICAKNLTDLCIHLRRFVHFFADYDLDKPFPLARKGVSVECHGIVATDDMNNNSANEKTSNVSNVTIDLDELLLAQRGLLKGRTTGSAQTLCAEGSATNDGIEPLSPGSEGSANLSGRQAYRKYRGKNQVKRNFLASKDAVSPQINVAGSLMSRDQIVKGPENQTPSLKCCSLEAIPNEQCRKSQVLDADTSLFSTQNIPLNNSRENPVIIVSGNQGPYGSKSATNICTADLQTYPITDLLGPKIRSHSSSSVTQLKESQRPRVLSQSRQLTCRSMSISSMFENGIGPPVLNSTRQEERSSCSETPNNSLVT